MTRSSEPICRPSIMSRSPPSWPAGACFAGEGTAGQFRQRVDEGLCADAVMRGRRERMADHEAFLRLCRAHEGNGRYGAENVVLHLCLSPCFDIRRDPLRPRSPHAAAMPLGISAAIPVLGSKPSARARGQRISPGQEATIASMAGSGSGVMRAADIGRPRLRPACRSSDATGDGDAGERQGGVGPECRPWSSAQARSV